MPLSKAWKKAKARRAILVTREQTLAEDPDVVPVISPVIIPADRAPSAPVIGPVIVPADMVAGATDVGPVNLTAFRAQKAPDISLHFGDTDLPTLHQALYATFQRAKHALVMIGSICSAVFLKDEEFWLFDSHSHGEYGLSDVDGKSVLMSFHKLENLVTFMYAMYESANIDIMSQYEILPLNFNVVQCTSQYHNMYINNQQKITDISKTDADDVWQTVSYKKQKKSTNFSVMPKDEQLCEVVKKTIKQQSIDHKVKERTYSYPAVGLKTKVKNDTILIGKYFKHQYQKQQQKNKEGESDRKAYMRLYMQKRRQSDQFKVKDKEFTFKSKRKARSDEAFKQKEIQIQNKSKQKARSDEAFKQKEIQVQNKSKKKARSDEAFKQKEIQVQNKSKKKARSDEAFKQKEIQVQNKSKKKARSDPLILEQEKIAKQESRKCPEYKHKEMQIQNKSKQKARTDEAFKQKEIQVQNKSKKKARSDPLILEQEKIAKQESRKCPEYKHKEMQIQNKSKQKARTDEAFKQKEIQVQNKSKRKARTDETFKQKETDVQNKSKRKARLNPYTLEKERVAKQQRRLDERNKSKEKILDCKRKSEKRKNPLFSEAEKVTAKRKKSGNDIEECIAKFHQNIQEGPIYVCSSCHQTWFKESVSEVLTFTCKDKNKYITGLKSVAEKEWICVTCKHNIKKGTLPKLSVLNGMEWPTKPKELELFPLGERLIALRIPFMQIRELPRGRQLSIKGNVVNVPVDIQPVVNTLPRPMNENITVAVKLKKKMSFQSCAFSENVRPLRVLIALHWLMNKSNLYKNANIDIDEQWIKDVTENSNEVINEFFESKVTSEIMPECDTDNYVDALNNSRCSSDNASHVLHKYFEENIKLCKTLGTVDFEDCVGEVIDCAKVKNAENKSSHSALEDLYDSDSEEVTNENVGNIDTLLDDADIENRHATFTFAPGEGQRPLSIFQDKDSEYLCFPSIFCGKRRIDNEHRKVPVNYSDIAKWELRSQDRRAANSVPNIFFKLKKIQMKQLNDKSNLAVRRIQTGTNKLTAAQARNGECMDTIVKNDQGYYLFKQLRNSPAYLESRKKDVYAMLRQLGIPTWFMSLSSADTRWTDLLKILANLNQKDKYSDEQIENLTWEQKIKMIQSDPVTCSRFFDHRVQEFINTVLKSDHNPLGKVTDYFYRVEFQQHGSPHIHMIVWVENAPKLNVDSIEEIAAYVDQYLKCSINNEFVGALVDIQIHKHSRTCRKKQDQICRFGYPLPPLQKTMVLFPLENDKDKYLKQYAKIQKRMNDQKHGYNMSFEKFLSDIAQMNEDDYIKCIRSSLNSPKVFLKRNPSEIRVNLYNDVVLKAWKANTDIQFVLDPYACAMYIVSYISKSQRGMSNLMYAAAKEARNGNLDIKRQVRHIGNVFSNSVEVSAQEAVYLVLQMPLTRSTRDVVFINTSVPNQRVQLLKSKSALDELPADSTDIMSDNIIKRYSKRPKALDNYCLADYVSQLEVIYPDDKEDISNSEQNDDEKHDEMSGDEYFDDCQNICVLKSGIKIRRRRNSKIIRYVRFNCKTDEENYYREKLLLFYPWRNEERDLLGHFATHKEKYESVQNAVNEKCACYEHHVDELELARNMAEEEYNAYDEIAPGTQQEEAETAEEEPVESETFIYFNPDRVSEQREYDIGIEIGCSVSSAQISSNENILSDEEYRALLRSLNSKQKEFYNHVVHWIKTKDAPLYTFLSGGAGVGKSVVIRALYQTLYRMLNLKEGENSDDVRVLLCAYTGKAAFNINGSTISSAFKQKYKQSDQTLTCDSLNTFRSKYRDLSVVIIDEISMVSNTMMSFINQRLQELKGTRKPFGGVSIIAVGDLFQLKPVNGDWIFNDLSRDVASLSMNLWKELFLIYELSEVMRQKDDLPFADLLNRLRINSLTTEDKMVLKGCEVESSAKNYQVNSPHLFAENYYMHIFNDTLLNSSNNQKVSILCHDSVVSPKLSKDKQEEAIKRLPTDPNRTANLHCSLDIVIGMLYDLTVNTNTEDGLANGASCVVKFIEYKLKETQRPSIIWVQFVDLKAGCGTRLKYKSRGFYHEQINENWTPTFDITRTFTYNKKTFERIQFPLQPSAGRSVHRAQGTTLDSVVIDLSQRKTRKVPHLHYVALSRVRSLEKLQILNFNEQALQVDDKVKTEMERLLKDASLELCYVPLESIHLFSKMDFKIAFNNCRSLNKHFIDVKHDQGLLSCDIIGLAETRLHENDNDTSYQIQGYHLIRNDQCTASTSERPPHGLLIYVKADVLVKSADCFSSQNFEFVLLNVARELSEMQVVVLYKSPKMSDSAFRTMLTEKLFPHLVPHKPLVILGDFNIDVLNYHRGVLQYLYDKLNCKLHLNEPTTDNLSALDLIITNIDATVGTVETYWSDHKIIYCCTERISTQ
ncbi:uncharacterized protein LOC132731041 [Ruditapes philippinarum]|uniref:uncharacterized protein LOC132731041 n=1 Tax=Ruditapes philippinarum TaxID=129788 RepID=UPI00295B4211|nr:uncharacterized protein LOC132731041 [Ruditapes philippinarum]